MNISPDLLPFLLGLAFFVAAGLYAAVGHGGASAYLAVMGLCGMVQSEMKPIALVLNIAVSAVATVYFCRAGHFRSALFWPLAVASIPAAFLGGALHASDEVFQMILSGALLVGAWRLVLSAREREDDRRVAGWLGLLALGGGTGFLAGLVGVGGGIFLTPMLLFLRWESAKAAAAVSAAFILVNSCAGICGFMLRGYEIPRLAWMLLPCVVAGGWLGSRWGSGFAHSITLRRTLACVLLVAAGKFLII